MEAGNPHKKEIGALVLQTGRQAGARRPLGGPATFVGRGQDCDIRANVDGVDSLHCVIIASADGAHLRDLESTSGSYVNGTRVDQAALRDGDVIKIGPFQFRLELTPTVSEIADERPVDEVRDALRIQAAAVAAQQAALEEEEIRLQQRRADLQQQEEQLAAHLDEKQRQVELWAEFTKTEREELRTQRAEQEKHLAELEKELWEAKEEVAKQQLEVAQSRIRIDQVYKRLRERWQRQWGAARIHQQRRADELAAEQSALREQQHDLDARKAAFAELVMQHKTEHELGVRTLHEERSALKKDRETWRHRRGQEQLVLKARARELEASQLKIRQVRQLLADEKIGWDRQQDSLQQELHGLNNRIVHQRMRIQEQQEELARLDTAVRERRLRLVQVGVGADGSVPDEMALDTSPARLTPVPADETTRRCHDLNRLAGELADQRAHLTEQYNRLAEIHDTWQQQRDHAAAELDALARRLVDEEQALAERERHTGAAEELLQERAREFEAARQELQNWNAQLKVREQTFAQQHQIETQNLRQHQKLLEEQLAGLAVLRQRWNTRRQQEIERLQAERAVLTHEQKETQDRRLALFEAGRQVDAAKRLLVEKALALEHFRAEISASAKDPAAQRRIERLRRRWLSTNSALIRNARSAGEEVRKEMADLETSRVELAQATNRLTLDQAALADQQAQLDGRETALKIRQQQLDLEIRRLQTSGADVETLAHAVYEEPAAPPIDKAA